MSKSVEIVAVLAMAAVVAGGAAIAVAAPECGSDAVNVAVPCDRVATAQNAAVLKVQGDTEATALEVTARPIAGVDTPYLVGVYVGDAMSPDAKLLGSFSFFPPRAGQSQTFVLPRPAEADKNLTLSAKLIPANPERDINGAAVEILGARLVAQ